MVQLFVGRVCRANLAFLGWQQPLAKEMTFGTCSVAQPVWKLSISGWLVAGWVFVGSIRWVFFMGFLFLRPKIQNNNSEGNNLGLYYRRL